jgi:23S rRNA (adenine2503-C2)-methyltransferase
MQKQNLLGYTQPQLESLMVDLGEKPFRGRQLFKWLYNSRQYNFAEMTDFTKDLRTRLSDQYHVQTLKLAKESDQKVSVLASGWQTGGIGADS